MRNTFFKIFVLGGLLLIAVSCATKKPAVVKAPEVVIPQPKAVVNEYDENYDSDIQRKWVDIV